MKNGGPEYVRVTQAALNRFWPLSWNEVVHAAEDASEKEIDVFSPDVSFAPSNYEAPTRERFPNIAEEDFQRIAKTHAENYGYAFLRQGEPPLGPEKTFLFKQNW